MDGIRIHSGGRLAMRRGKGSDVGMKQERIQTDIGEQNGIVMCEPFQGDSKLLSCACLKKSFGNFLLSVISRPGACRARCISLVVWCFSNFSERICCPIAAGLLQPYRPD
jgi:hypothetical protein